MVVIGRSGQPATLRAAASSSPCATKSWVDVSHPLLFVLCFISQPRRFTYTIPYVVQASRVQTASTTLSRPRPTSLRPPSLSRGQKSQQAGTVCTSASFGPPLSPLLHLGRTSCMWVHVGSAHCARAARLRKPARLTSTSSGLQTRCASPFHMGCTQVIMAVSSAAANTDARGRASQQQYWGKAGRAALWEDINTDEYKPGSRWHEATGTA